MFFNLVSKVLMIACKCGLAILNYYAIVIRYAPETVGCAMVTLY